MAFSSSFSVPILPSWKPPQIGVLKLNFDGSALGNPGPSGIGGLIGDNLGASHLSFSSPSGFHLVNETDLLALQTSLREAARLGFSNFIAKGDFFYAIRGASCSAAYPWRMADICKVLELASFPL